MNINLVGGFIMKQCKTCKQFKPINDFYRKSRSRSHLGDGHEARCKECAKTYAKSPEQRKAQNERRRDRRKTDPEWYSKQKERNKKFSQTEGGKKLHKLRNEKYRKTKQGKESEKRSRQTYQRTEKYKKAIKRYRAKNPEKRKAQWILSNAIRSGKVIRPSMCSACNVQCVPEGHHYDYTKPLDVIWMCKRCHTDLHYSNI